MTASNPPDAVATILRDPTWFSHRYDPGQDTVHFLRLLRDEHRRAIFLTDQYLGPQAPRVVIRRDQAVAAARSVAGPVHFIFHSAFCCSTVIARALDRDGWAMGLKEPVILNDLVGWRRRGATPAQLHAALDDALTLLARPFEPGEAIVIKPSNLLNGLSIEMMALRPRASALLMYAPLPDFLASIAKKGLDGRLFVRTLFVDQLKDGIVRLGFDQDQLFAQTDLQIAAMGWLAQKDVFRAMIARFGPDRVRSIDSVTLLADPARTMAAVAGLFHLADDPATVATIAGGSAFTTHSKHGSGFGAQARANEYAVALATHSDEIAKVVAWTTTVAERAGIPLDPGAPLLG